MLLRLRRSTGLPPLKPVENSVARAPKPGQEPRRRQKPRRRPLQLCTRRDRSARRFGKPRQPLTCSLKFIEFLGELAIGIVAFPAAILLKLDEMRLATLRQGEPFARDTVVRTILPCRHGEAEKARGIEAFSSSNVCLIRAMKIRMAGPAPAIDLPLVDKSRRIKPWRGFAVAPRSAWVSL